MSRMQPNLAQAADAGDTKQARSSFYCRCKAVMRAMPLDLDAGARLLLLTLFMHADDDGGGIFVGNAALCEMTGIPRSSLFRHLATLTKRGYLLPDGCQVHASGARTRRRRIDLVALQLDRTNPAAAAVESPTVSLTALVESPTHETRESPTHGTQTKRANREKESPPLRSGPASGSGGSASSPRNYLIKEGGGPVQTLTGLTERRAHSFVGYLVKLAGEDCGRVLQAIRQAERDRPVDARTWLIAACRGERISHETAISRKLGLRSYGDPSYAAAAA